MAACPMCGGRGGFQDSDGWDACDRCSGTGQVPDQSTSRCRACNGQGYWQDEDGSETCTSCGGRGYS